jgi:hypothetical protein
VHRTRFAVLIALVLVARPAAPQGNPLGPEFRVNTLTQSQQGYSAAASGGSGFVVVWRSSAVDGSLFGVSGQRFDSGGAPLGTEFRVNTYTTGVQDLPALGVNAAGDLVVVWESDNQDGSDTGVFGQRYSSDGTPRGPEFGVNNTAIGEQSSPAVAVDPAGGFLVAWHSRPSGSGDFDVFARRYGSSGAPAGPEFRVNASTLGSHSGPSVAADTSGNYVIVWSGGFGDANILGLRYSGSGAPLGPEFVVNTYLGFLQNDPAVATDPSGNFVVVWASRYQEGSYAASYGVFGQRFASSGAPLGPEFRVNTYTTGFQGRPAVATDAAGNFVVTWWDWVQPGSGFGVFAQRFAADGAPSGPEFRVNTQTTPSQRSPSIASDAAGTFLVTWHSDVGQDVYGQRFGGIFPVELTHFRVE